MAVRCKGARVGLDPIGPLKKGAFLFLTTGKIPPAQIVLKLGRSENRLAATKAQHSFCDHLGIYGAGGLGEVIIGIHRPIPFVLLSHKLVSGANCLLVNTNLGIHVYVKPMSYPICITPGTNCCSATKYMYYPNSVHYIPFFFMSTKLSN